MNHSRQFQRSNGGFSLIELLMALLILSLLAAVAGPSFQSTIQRGRLASSLSSIGDMLILARSEAVVRTKVVSACGSTDSATCDTSNWESGWLVFVDDGAGAGVANDGILNGSEEILRIGSAAKTDVSIRTVNFASTSAVSFTEDGLAASTGTFVICDARGATHASGLVLNRSGQTRLALDSTGTDKTVEDNSGTAVTCP